VNDFVASFKSVSEGGQNAKPQGLFKDNAIWASTVLASSGAMYGLVVHTGIETRVSMNRETPQQKFGKVDMEIDFVTKLIFLMMTLLAIVMQMVAGFNEGWAINIFRIMLLLCAIIPISMKVNLDFAKIYYTFNIRSDDKLMPGCIPRTTTIPEELGRIQFLLSDKTGTLTQNDMVFKKLAMEYQTYDDDTWADLERAVRDGCQEKAAVSLNVPT